MKIFDFNIHLPYDLSDTVENISANEMVMNDDLLVNAFEHYKSDFSSLSGMNFMLFNTKLFNNINQSKFIELSKSAFPESMFTALVDFRQSDPYNYIDNAKACGVKSIKFHPYIQKICETDFSAILKVAQYAESQNMILCVDASYGTTGMYKYDNLKLICHLADYITKVPIIILHSGGARCIEAMLIAVEKNNVYLETSFSLKYYLGSTIETDLAFVYKKMESKKILYASDAPYVPVSDSIKTTLNFLEKHGFSSQEIELIFYCNANNLLNHD